MSQLITKRLKAARERIGCTQAQLAERLGFKDRQTLAAIESGQRKVSADELLRAVQVLGVDIDYFMDSFRLVGEGKFSWRTTREAAPRSLAEFEERAGRWIATYRKLGERNHAVDNPLQMRLAISKRSSFEDAMAAAEALGRAWDLGEIPALRLESCVRDQLHALVLNVDAPRGISGAACQLPGFNTILINRDEPEGRRHYDLAHEIFHLLTWEQMPPEHAEGELPRGGKGNRIEQLADNFASALLMPERTLAPRWQARADMELHRWLNSTASELLVTASALRWRLVQLGWLDRADQIQIDEGRLTANGRAVPAPSPRLFGSEFVGRLHDGIFEGHLSVRRAASLLDMSIDDLAELFLTYEMTVPFDL
jgi:XRE family transcriptional regulator, fatty acid utilization regulator